MKLHFKAAGLICFSGGERHYEWNLHLLVKRRNWTWGYDPTDWYDGPVSHFGLGPFLHFVWRPRD